VSSRPAGSSAAAQARIWEIIRGPWQYCAAALAFTQLGVAGTLTEGPASTASLATRCHADTDALGRLLRCCASLGLITAAPGDRWALTVAGTTLCEGGPMRAAVLANSGPPGWGAMLRLADAVRAGQPVFEQLAGEGFYDWHASNPDCGEVFQQFMTSRSAAAAQVIAGLSFAGAAVVADIGGGYGTILAAVLAAHPHLHGILLDRDEVLPGAAGYLAAHGTDGRCVLTAGDYLNAAGIPAADVYLLGSILHNHPDDEARRILAGLTAANGRARVICADILLPDDPCNPDTGTDLDMRRLAIGGRERTRDQYAALLGSAGLTITAVLPTPSPLSVIDSRIPATG
jgi:hypothetical protein